MPGRLPLLLLAVVGCRSGDTCPAEMARIGEGDGAFCLDRWEAQLVDPQGHVMLKAPPVLSPGPHSRSGPGVLPTVGISFDAAALACAATEAVVDGKVYDHKHLTTEAEWVDGADGRIGPGGRRWPWGETEEAGRCNSPANGSTALAATGIAPRCVSVEGVYDQVGNAFEWADSGLRVDVDAALARFAREGAELLAGPDDALIAGATADLRRLNSFATAINPATLRRDEDRHLWMRWAGSLARPKGFLVVASAGGRDAEAMLPVRFATQEGSSEAQLYLWREGDGTPIPVKIGGAWYAGQVWPDAEVNHTSDFLGTIGFRCAVRPY